jgi:hypothetical protein
MCFGALNSWRALAAQEIKKKRQRITRTAFQNAVFVNVASNQVRQPGENSLLLEDEEVNPPFGGDQENNRATESNKKNSGSA